MQSTQKAKHPEDLQKMIREMYSVHTNPNSPQTGKKTGDKSFRKKELIKLKMGEFMQDAKFKKYIRRIDKSLKDELRMSIVNNALLDFLLVHYFQQILGHWPWGFEFEIDRHRKTNQWQPKLIKFPMPYWF